MVCQRGRRLAAARRFSGRHCCLIWYPSLPRPDCYPHEGTAGSGGPFVAPRGRSRLSLRPVPPVPGPVDFCAGVLDVFEGGTQGSRCDIHAGGSFPGMGRARRPERRLRRLEISMASGRGPGGARRSATGGRSGMIMTVICDNPGHAERADRLGCANGGRDAGQARPAGGDPAQVFGVGDCDPAVAGTYEAPQRAMCTWFSCYGVGGGWPGRPGPRR